MTCKAFMDVGKLPQLEHLTINTNFAFNIEASNFFLVTLVKGCPKLRSVELCNYFTAIKNVKLISKPHERIL